MHGLDQVVMNLPRSVCIQSLENNSTNFTNFKEMLSFALKNPDCKIEIKTLVIDHRFHEKFEGFSIADFCEHFIKTQET